MARVPENSLLLFRHPFFQDKHGDIAAGRWFVLKFVLDFVDRAIGTLMVILISAMLVIGGAQVFCRYILDSSLSWSEELMRFLYVWIVMIGINLGIRHKSIAAITSLSDMIGKRSLLAARIMAVVSFAVQLFACVVLCLFGVQFALANKQMSPALRIPMSVIYWAIPIGAGMSVVYTVNGIAEWYREQFHKEP